jgi:hypothetical protein
MLCEICKFNKLTKLGEYLTSIKKANSLQAKVNNRLLFIKTIYKNIKTPTASITRTTGLTRAAVSASINELKKEVRIKAVAQ